jgi:hypothetical protein
MDVADTDAAAGVPATLNYVAPWSAKNRLYVAPGAHLTTTEYDPHAVRISDGRPHSDEFTLDRNGFVFARHTSAVSDFADAAEVERTYPGEAVSLVKRLTGADLVISGGWVLRRSGTDLKGAQPPAPDVHVDLHPDRAAGVLENFHATQGLPGRTFRRAIYSSLWRAFSPPPQDCPLAVLDYTSVADTEGVANLLLFVAEPPDPVPDTIEDPQSQPAGTVFTFSPAHRWWYFPGMTSSEVLLIKLHDTDHSVAWRAPHTAFRDPSVPPGHLRESIEIRTVAFFY